MSQTNETFIKEILEIDRIDPTKLSNKQLDEMYQVLNGEMNRLYRFIFSYTDYMNHGHEYSENETLSMLEVHLLTDICDQPDSTVTALAQAWNRSTSATSQTIKKLINKKLVTKEQSPTDGKVFFLRPTELGIEVSKDHKEYDIIDTVKTFKTLRHHLTEKEIQTFFKGLDAFFTILQKNK